MRPRLFSEVCRKLGVKAFALIMLQFFGPAELNSWGQRSGPKAFSLTGVVSLDNSRPSSAKVVLEALQVTGGAYVLVRACSTLADERGFFRCEGLAPGSYLLHCTFSTSKEHDSVMERVVFYPGVANVDQATIIRLTSDQQVSITGISSTMHSISGLLSDDAAELVQVTALNVSQGVKGLRIPASTRFLYEPRSRSWTVFGVANGTYEVIVNWVSGKRPRSANMTVIVRDRDVSGVRTLDQIGQALHGRVEVEEDSTLPSEIALTSDESRATYSLSVDANGDFAFPSIRAGRYHLSKAGAGLFVRSVAIDDRTQPSTIVDIIDGLDADVLVQLAQSRGAIEGRVLSDDGEGRGSQLVVEDQSTGDCVWTQADSRGRFRLDHVSPGDYLLYALPMSQSLAYKEPTVLERYRSGATPLHVKDQVISTSVAMQEN